MPNTKRPRDLVPTRALVALTVREHRAGIVAWVVGSALAMAFEAFALAKELREFPGGPVALANVVMPAVEAMRPLRWPAERLDTIGGYLTFHNIVLFQAFLAIYGAVQGARAIRGLEERHALESMIASGRSRWGLLCDRALGFLVVDVLIAVGLGAGIALSMMAVGEADTAGSFINALAIGACTLAAYAFGLLVSQLAGTGRGAAGVSVVVLFVLYLITNTWERIGVAGVLRFASPFYWANMSRALVPGYGLDLGSIIMLAAMAVAFLVLAGIAFARRDYGAALWPRRARAGAGAPAVTQRWWLRRPWTAQLAVHRIGLTAWAVSVAAYAAFMMAMQPTVMEAWSMIAFVGDLMGSPQTPKETLYTSFTGDVAAPIVVAFVITQASTWVADLREGRVEAVLATPVSWSRLVFERLVATAVGVAVITLAWTGATVAVSLAVGAPIDLPGVLRLDLVCLLLGVATAVIAAFVVNAVRLPLAVTVLAAYAGAAYLLTWLIPIFEWPDWLGRLTVFDAFGHPYQDWPAWTGLAVLLLLVGPGAVVAARIAERAPKVG